MWHSSASRRRHVPTAGPVAQSLGMSSGDAARPHKRRLAEGKSESMAPARAEAALLAFPHGYPIYRYDWQGKGLGKSEFHSLKLAPLGSPIFVVRGPLAENVSTDLAIKYPNDRPHTTGCNFHPPGEQITKEDRNRYPLLSKRLIYCDRNNWTLTLWSSTLKPDLLLIESHPHHSLAPDVAPDQRVSRVSSIAPGAPAEPPAAPIGGALADLEELRKEDSIFLAKLLQAISRDAVNLLIAFVDRYGPADLGCLRLRPWGATICHEAIAAGAASVLDYILHLSRLRGLLLVNQGTVDTSSTPLHRAAFYGRVEMTQKLLDRGADVFAFTSTGKFLPVHVLCQSLAKQKQACPDRLAILNLLMTSMMRIDATRAKAAAVTPSVKHCDTGPVQQWLVKNCT